MKEIKDSGTRREFAGPNGPVRDVAEGKGRFDLMPLGVVSGFIRSDFVDDIDMYLESKNIDLMYDALEAICDEFYEGNQAVMMLEVAKHFEAGCKKYGPNNWRKEPGIPVSSYIDSMLRHYFKVWAGWEDEPHKEACVWNVMCCIWQIEHEERGKQPSVLFDEALAKAFKQPSELFKEKSFTSNTELVCEKCGNNMDKGYAIQEQGKVKKICTKCYMKLMKV